MRKGDPRDPLLLQVLPVLAERTLVPGFMHDPVGDLHSRASTGVLHKYEGRALIIATGACAVHCRYCFRRHYPYGDESALPAGWQKTIEAVRVRSVDRGSDSERRRPLELEQSPPARVLESADDRPACPPGYESTPAIPWCSRIESTRICFNLVGPAADTARDRDPCEPSARDRRSSG